MKITFDQKANAAYIYLIPREGDEPLHMYPCDPIGVGGIINLDFDSKGFLVGIEVLNATALLPEALLITADIID